MSFHYALPYETPLIKASLVHLGLLTLFHHIEVTLRISPKHTLLCFIILSNPSPQCLAQIWVQLFSLLHSTIWDATISASFDASFWLDDTSTLPSVPPISQAIPTPPMNTPPVPSLPTPITSQNPIYLQLSLMIREEIKALKVVIVKKNKSIANLFTY